MRPRRRRVRFSVRCAPHDTGMATESDDEDMGPVASYGTGDRVVGPPQDARSLRREKRKAAAVPAVAAPVATEPTAVPVVSVPAIAAAATEPAIAAAATEPTVAAAATATATATAGGKKKKKKSAPALPGTTTDFGVPSSSRELPTYSQTRNNSGASEALRKIYFDALLKHHTRENVEATETNWIEDWGKDVRGKFGEVETSLALRKHSRATWWANLVQGKSNVAFKDINVKLRTKGDDYAKNFMDAMGKRKADLPIDSRESMETFLVDNKCVTASFLESDPEVVDVIWLALRYALRVKPGPWDQNGKYNGTVVGAGGGASTPGRTKFRSPTRGTAGSIEAATTQVTAVMEKANTATQQALGQLTTAVLDRLDAPREDVYSQMRRFERSLERGMDNGNFAPASFLLGELRNANAPDRLVLGYQNELDSAEAAYANRSA